MEMVSVVVADDVVEVALLVSVETIGELVASVVLAIVVLPLVLVDSVVVCTEELL